MTAGNYATAQKHHTSHLWCADTAVESDPGLTHSRKKETKHKCPPPLELPPGTSLKGGTGGKKKYGPGVDWSKKKILMGLEVKKGEEALCL